MKKLLYRFLQIIFIVGITFSAYKIVNWYLDNKKNEKIVYRISKYINVEDKKTTVDFDELKKVNDEIIGYLIVNNVNVNYPVVKHSDNEYYLSHNLEKQRNSAGWLFLDYRNNLKDKNMIIYGHNMKNGSMFGNLNHVLKKDWQENVDNQKITFITENKEYTYQVFSTYRIEAEDYYITTNFTSDDEYIKFLNQIKNRSNYDYNIKLDKDDKILTLSTCSNSNYRVVLHAKLIGED